jgi:hypothetical protein
MEGHKLAEMKERSLIEQEIRDRREEQDTLHISLMLSQRPLADGWTDAEGRVVATLGRRSGRAQSIPHFRGFEAKIEVPDPRPFFLSVCSGHHVLGSREVRSGEDSVRVQITPERLNFQRANAVVKVIDAISGAPIAQAEAALTVEDRPGFPIELADEEGMIHFEQVICGPRFLTITAPGYEDVHEEVAIEPIREVDLGTRRLPAATWISGRVIADGAAGEGVVMRAQFLARLDPDAFADRPATNTSRADGSFRIDSVAHGKQLVRVADKHWAAPPIVVDTTSGPVEDLVLHASRSADARFWFDVPPPESTLWITDFQPLPVFEKALSRDRVLIVPLAPGRYTWWMETRAKKTEPRELVVGANGVEVQVSR